MGSRVSISFVDGKRESGALSSHWGGKEFVGKACEYVIKVRKRKRGGSLSPQKVMEDFIREIKNSRRGRQGIRDGDIYLAEDYTYADNGDHGHFRIDLRGPKFWWKAFLFPWPQD